ncbi:MAG: hypothetical protein KBA26_14885 [Candidatus Delongbacteria bacterium]|nr:hypothetical protein [Candidatus Delongbacteria bacterium]
MSPDIKPYLIVIYGKNDCPLCAGLLEEMGRVLGDEAVQRNFDLDYQNLSTIEGMEAYAKSETVNGQRIPALQIMKYDPQEEVYRKIPDTRPERYDEVSGELIVPAYLQLQTGASPHSAITADRIRELMEMALTSA